MKLSGSQFFKNTRKNLFLVLELKVSQTLSENDSVLDWSSGILILI